MFRNAIVWEATAFAGVLSMLLMMLIARRWKISWRPALLGITLSVCTASLFFAWFDSRYKTGWVLVGGIFGQIVLAHTCAFILIMLRFWRDPERIPPQEKGIVLSAADGKVLYIKGVDTGSMPLVTKSNRDYLLTELMGTELISNSAYIIGIAMNMINVHINRCPIEGQVILVNRIQGNFMSLGRVEALFTNERCTTIIKNPVLTLAVVQVASRLVRYIENYLSTGQEVSAGQKLGKIRFGSLVVVVVPKRDDVRITVNPGDEVTAGVSVLARYLVSSKTVRLQQSEFEL